ncbi:hypothetical protein ACQK5W_00180 [Pantoea sp. FN060301]|uniref:hypothetical protein n=1 Tax=Pantoea sp. FN060301 TaxID=3420380 RepID=UPI003D1638E8
MKRKDYLSWAGIICGSAALLLLWVSFMAGPFSPRATLEGMIAMKAVAIKQATYATLRGKELIPAAQNWDTDRIIDMVIAVLSASAVICGVIGGVLRENRHAAGAAILFGISVVAFQFALLIVGGLLLALVIFSIAHGIFT